MGKIYAFLFAALASMSAWAQIDRGGNVIHDDDGDYSAPLLGPWLIPVLAGAAIGYFVERAYNKAKLDKEGVKYSSEYLGGKTGAIVGAIALPLLIGLMK